MNKVLNIFYGIIILTSSTIAQITDYTQLERSDFTELTSYTNMMTYLNSIVDKSSDVSMEIIGKSVLGRNIPALFFSMGQFGQNRNEKPVVWIMCQQHGNEPSGKEAALIVIRKLIDENKNLLNSFDLILIPQVNPDGGELGQRRNANGIDLNRNHVILSEPESNAIHRLFLKWRPEVTLDIHEFNAIKERWITHGFTKDAEEMLGGNTNLNIDESIRLFSKNNFIPIVGKKIVASGYRFHEYIVGSPFKPERVRFSTTNINDGRQSFGIYNTMSFIIEGKRYGDLITNIKRRTTGQIAAIISFLETVGEKNTEILKIVNETRIKLIDKTITDRKAGIRMDYYPDENHPTLNYPIFNLYTWQHEVKELENYTPIVKIKQSVNIPFAYVIPQPEERLINLLNKHQIKFRKLESPEKATVQKYLIQHVTDFTEEDKPALFVDAAKIESSEELPTGTVMIETNQPAINLLPLMLEPQSSWGIVTESAGRKYRFKEYIKEGQTYPIWRIEKPVEY